MKEALIDLGKHLQKDTNQLWGSSGHCIYELRRHTQKISQNTIFKSI